MSQIINKMATYVDNRHSEHEMLLVSSFDTLGRKKSHRRTPIHKSVLKHELCTLENLLRANLVDVNATDQYGNTALHYAVISDDERIFRTLLKHPQTDINIRNQANRTPLHWALDKFKVNAITALVQRPDIQLENENDREDRTCRQILIQKHSKLATKLLKLKPFQLLGAFNEKQLDEFEKILHLGDDHVYYFYTEGIEYPGTLLDIACRSSGNGKFVQVLLQSGARINAINPITGRAAIHEAVLHSDAETVRILRQNGKFQVNILDILGNSAVHHAVHRNNVEIMKILLDELGNWDGNGSKNESMLQEDHLAIDITDEIPCKAHPSIDINAINHLNQTPLHVALLENRRPSIDILLDEPCIDLDVQKDLENRTCRQIIIDRFSQLKPKLQQIPVKLDQPETLFSLLHRHDKRTFVERIKTVKPSSTITNGKHTYLQFACKHGMADVARALLDVGIDPNEYPSTEKQTPAMIASHGGYLEILSMLLNHPQISFEPIESTTVLHSVMYGLTHEDEFEMKPTKENCKHYKCLRYILDHVIENGKVDINYANEKGSTALHIAASPKLNEYPVLRDLLNKGAYLCQKNNFGREPIESMNPSYLKRYLDSCITFEGLPLRDNYKMMFNYRSLIPPITSRAPEIEPLYRMSKDPDLRPLLEHPVIRSYLGLKWQGLKIYAEVNLAFYAFFWILQNFYYFDYFTCSRRSETSDPTGSQLHNILSYLVGVSCAILVLRELYQCLLSPKSYFQTEMNYFEMALISMTFLFLGFDSTLDLNLAKFLASITIILSSLELITLVGRLPAFSSNLTMVKAASISCLNFIAWYSILLLGLAFAFSILGTVGTHNLDTLEQPATFLYNVSLMVTGHVNNPSVADDKSMQLYHILFLSVIFLSPIVNGIALGRIGEVQGKAKMLSIIAQIGSTFRLESMVNEDACGLLRVTNKFIRKTFGNRIAEPYDRCVRKTHCKPLFLRCIRLGDYIRPTYQIIILPNERNKVQIPIPWSDNCSGLSQKSYTHFNKKSFVIDASIVADAANILEERNTPKDDSSRNDIENILTRYNSKFEAIENSVKMMHESMANLISILDSKIM